jgi:hypothetical protein
MSRTDNTAPIRIQEADGKLPCATIGGAYRGIGKYSRRANRKIRKRVNVQLKKWIADREPDVSQSRHAEKYFYW